MTAERTNLDAWFVHPKLALNLLSTAAAQQVQDALPPHTHPLWRHFHMNAMERALAAAFSEIAPKSIAVGHLEETLQVGQLAWAEQRFFYRGVRKASSEVSQGRPGRVDFHARLATDQSVRILGDFNAEHLTSATSVNQLSGSRNQFVLGYISQLDEGIVEVRPILIADRWVQGSGVLALSSLKLSPHTSGPLRLTSSLASTGR